MDGLIALVVVVGALVLLDALAAAFGVDSRDPYSLSLDV
jgi:hypothetical protein